MPLRCKIAQFVNPPDRFLLVYHPGFARRKSESLCHAKEVGGSICVAMNPAVNCYVDQTGLQEQPPELAASPAIGIPLITVETHDPPRQFALWMVDDPGISVLINAKHAPSRANRLNHCGKRLVKCVGRQMNEHRLR
jgi:hypothetical protein